MCCAGALDVLYVLFLCVGLVVLIVAPRGMVCRNRSVQPSGPGGGWLWAPLCTPPRAAQKTKTHAQIGWVTPKWGGSRTQAVVVS